MASGPAHFQEAERLLDHMNNIPDPHGDGAHAVNLLAAEAQVHATLALAAATADPFNHVDAWTEVVS